MDHKFSPLNGDFGLMIEGVTCHDLEDKIFQREAYDLWTRHGGLIAVRGPKLAEISPEQLLAWSGVFGAVEDTVLGCIAAQKRPPEQTWWVQGVSGNQGIADTMEVGLDELKAMLTGFHAPIFMQGGEALGDLADALDIRPLIPSAVTAALKAPMFDPASHPPAPVYARDPDAKLPEPKS